MADIEALLFTKSLSLLRTIREFRSNPLADFESLNEGLRPATAGPTNIALIRRVIDAYRCAVDAQAAAPKPYQLSAEWGPIIREEKAEYIDAFSSGDETAVACLLESFFRNSGSAGLVDYGRYEKVSQAPFWRRAQFINDILNDYAVWRKLTGQEGPEALDCPRYGNSWGYIIGDTLVQQTACRHHFLAQRCLELTADVESPVVMEIGGGTGTFAYCLLSARPGLKWIDFDLPDTLAIASYYLGSAFPDARMALYGEDDPRRVLRHLSDYDFVLYPNFALPLLPAGSVDLVSNTRSLSEMAYDTVDEYIRQISRCCRSYFIHENSVAARKVWYAPEVPAQAFPIDTAEFKFLYQNMSPWRSGNGRYREHVLLKRHAGRRVRGDTPPRSAGISMPASLVCD